MRIVERNHPEHEPLPRVRLTEARVSLALSQQEVAEKIGTTHVNVSRWERGITKPNPYFRRKLCQLFGKTAQELDLVPSPEEQKAEQQAAERQQAAREEASKPHERVPIYDSAIPLQPAIRLVGRDKEMALIKKRLFTGGNVALTALNGLPGVGKTALSVALAHDAEVRAHFRDGILWAALGPKPNVLGLLGRWGTLLGIAPSEMASLSDGEAWAKAIHHAIGSRAMLLVIDDAWNVEEALAFKVGGPNCAHLLTTRHSDIATFIAMDGATRIEELGVEESMTLLRSLAPMVVDREPQKALDLVQAVGGLPLALTLMGNYLRKQSYSGHARRIAAALERLSDAEARLMVKEPHGPVEGHSSLESNQHISLVSVISVTDQLLSEEARAALYNLSVIPAKPNTFSEDMALAVAACDVEVLDMLSDSGILESNGTSRYMIHQVIRDYAAYQLELDNAAERAARGRLLDFVLDFVETNKDDYQQLEQESTNILAAMEMAYNLQVWETLVRCALAFIPHFMRHGSYALAGLHLQHAIEAAQALSRKQDIALLQLYYGQVLQQQGDFVQAETTFQDGLEVARQIEDQSLISAFLNDLGWVNTKMGKYDLAEDYLQQGLTIARQIGDLKRISSILMVLGSVSIYLGDYAKSEAYLQEGLRLAQQIGDQELTCFMLSNLGVNAGQRGDFSVAAQYFREGLALARKIGQKDRICSLLTNLSGVEIELGKYQQAENSCQEGLEIAYQIEHKERLSALLINQGIAFRGQRKFERAKRSFENSLKLARKIGNPFMIALALCEYGTLLLDLEEIEKAKEAFQDVLTITPKGAADLLALAQYGLAKIAASRGEIEKAKALGSESAVSLENMGHRNAHEVRDWLASL